MFVMTAINFLLSSVYTRTELAIFIVFIQKALILDIDYPLSAKPALVNNAVQNLTLVQFWSGNLPVSSNLSLLDDGSCIHSCSVEALFSDVIII